jgi:hypothetical protein
MDTSTILKRISVTPDDLLLDPNNPRLIQDLHFGDRCPDVEVLRRQGRIEQMFATRSRGDTSDEFTDISDLYDSMKRIGYVGIDRIVVRELSGLNKYLVIEGNRRVSTIKLIRKRAEKAIPELSEADLANYKTIKDSFENIDVLVLKTQGLTQDEIDHRVSVILGLRHFGSVQDWKPINRAFNAYQNYMGTAPPLHEFEFKNQRVMDVASRLSVSKSQVKKSLQTYIVYRQLTKIDSAIEDDHYSLVEAGLGLCSYGYFRQDSSTFTLTDSSLSKLVDLCQFDRRKEDKGKNALIISEPKKFKVLGRILKIAAVHDNETIRIRAQELVTAVEQGEIDQQSGELVMSVDKALSLLVAEINRKEWVDTVNKLLDEQTEKIPLEQYDGEGNHLLAKEQLEMTIIHLRTIFGVK